ncbi:NAD(P)H-dependent oxidoreductase [Mucilaginibacter sp. BJC16-A38]|uniref:NADPH-dependent FMN reductase n=1 Tax=Mucilaginibacter phenanthrenivorans TaxID=1234842 RepID=UPI00215850A6|nr:NADPH-dependent FMN reductase [Mucilaginibacter phenanthrenivorans]MCR8556883.1 NAD(P)H-dependent oxidoreductase [Mucilaginibacter phenanthrenivorans]
MLPSPKKRIFAISGSLRPGSSNHNILRYLGATVSADVDYFVYDSLAQIPPFDPGNDNENPPQAVSELRSLISNADAIIICTPEYAFGVPGQLKNALDWTVSSGSFSGKSTALITASTGGENGHAALIKILGAIDADLQKDATLLIPFIRSKMDDKGNISDEETAEKIKHIFEGLLKSLA